MKHIVTISHEVEAESWDLAIEAVLRDPIEHVSYVKVKPHGARLVHIAVSNFKMAYEEVRRQIGIEENDE